MIDTIKAYLQIDPDRDPISVSDLSSRLEKARITKGESLTGYLNGYLNNIKVSILFHSSSNLVNRVTVTGSAPKFLFSNNLATCSLSDTQTFIDSISSALDIDMDDAIVTSLDFGLNFSVSRPIPDYIAAIKGYPRIHKTIYQKESITMTTKSKNWAITFYDKIKEISDNNRNHQRMKIPEELTDLKILRYEIRYRKQPHKKLEREKSIKLKDLSSSKLTKQLFEVLRSTFENIQIQELEYPTANIAESSGFLKTYLALIGLYHFGYDRMNNIIDQMHFGVKNPAVKRSTLKKQLKTLASQNNEFHKCNLRNELEAKFDALEVTFL